MPRLWTLKNEYAVKPVTIQKVQNFDEDEENKES